MSKRQIGPRIPESAHEWYASHFANANAGASYILEAFPVLYRSTLMRELRGRFTRPELMLMIDACNGLLLTGHLAGQHLQIEVGDGIELNRLDEKWQVDRDQITNKLSALSVCQLAVLEIWTRAYWESAWQNDEASKMWVDSLADTGGES